MPSRLARRLTGQPLVEEHRPLPFAQSDFDPAAMTVSLEHSDALGRGEMEFLVVARFRDIAVGGVLYNVVEDEPGVAWVRDVQVHEALRRRGIGTAIYDWIRKHQDIGEIKTLGNVRLPDGEAFRKAYDR